MDKTERRQQMLSHARDVFARRGYHDANVDEIVKAAGVARGTFYLYFEDKRAVFEEIIDRFIAKLAMSILRVDPRDPSRTVAEQVRENIRRIVHLLLEDRATTKILLSDALGVDVAFDRKLHSFYDEVSKLLEESLREGQDLKVVEKGDVTMYACMTLGALKELVYQVVIRDWDTPEEKLVGEVMTFLRRGYLRVEESAAPAKKLARRRAS
ncbi:MAG: TetR/AcrR family transcriptional regulator [Polyangiaceae bacterium]